MTHVPINVPIRQFKCATLTDRAVARPRDGGKRKKTRIPIAPFWWKQGPGYKRVGADSLVTDQFAALG